MIDFNNGRFSPQREGRWNRPYVCEWLLGSIYDTLSLILLTDDCVLRDMGNFGLS